MSLETSNPHTLPELQDSPLALFNLFNLPHLNNKGVLHLNLSGAGGERKGDIKNMRGKVILQCQVK